MQSAQTTRLQKRFFRSIRRAWVMSVRMARSNPADAQLAAERFANVVIRRSLDAGYSEARHLGTNVFDPVDSGARFRSQRSGIVAEFLKSLSATSSGLSGLTEAQVVSVRSYRTVLETAGLDAFDIENTPKYTRGQVNRQVNRLVKVMTEQRADFLGRTLANMALNMGVEESGRQNIEQGLVEIINTWNTYQDEKVRSSHAPMQGQQKPHGEPFLSGKGNLIKSPGDYEAPISETAHCRCYLTTEVKP
jgi:hypothetical protein